MKTVFIETKYKDKIKVDKINPEKLPQKLGLVSTVQFVDSLFELKTYLESHGKKVYVEKGLQKYAGQVLGCEQSAAKRITALVDAFLYIGDGQFHPIGISLQTGKQVYTFDPFTNSLSKVDRGAIEKIKMKKKAQLMRFHASDEIGVIISTKPGQNKLATARNLKKEFPKKNFYLVLFDNVDVLQLENFNFVQCWINTACPRIQEDYNLLNIDDLRHEVP